MSSSRASGNTSHNLILELARIIAANPGIQVASAPGKKRAGRSLVQRQASKLATAIGVERRFTLAELVGLLASAYREQGTTRRLLVSPRDMLDTMPSGRGVGTIPDYLEAALRQAAGEVVLLTPFWDTPTLVGLFRGLPGPARAVDLVLLLVDMAPRATSIAALVSEIQCVWLPKRIRVFVHRTRRSKPANYPHAKCLVVDRSHGYLGSANFTQQGLRGHFEVGVSLNEQDSRTLARILEYLWSSSGLFKLAWDSEIADQQN